MFFKMWTHHLWIICIQGTTENCQPKPSNILALEPASQSRVQLLTLPMASHVLRQVKQFLQASVSLSANWGWKYLYEN